MFIYITICAVSLTYILYLLREQLPFFRYTLIFVVLAASAAKLSKTELSLALTVTIISIGLSYGLFLVSSFVSVTVAHLFYNGGSVVMAAVATVSMQIMAIYFLFKIKRFSKGIPFLKKRGSGTIGCIVSVLVLIIYILLYQRPSFETGLWLLFGIILCILGLIAWWRRGLTKHYRERVKERDMKEYEKIIAEKDLQIKKLTEDNDAMSSLIHRDNKLLPALSDAVLKYVDRDAGESEDGKLLLLQISQLMKERSYIIKRRQSDGDTIKLVNNPMLESLLNQMMQRAYEEDISLEIANANENSIPAEATIQAINLQTIIADLIENAINATKYCDVKKVRVTFSFEAGVYEIKIMDSGKPFDAEALQNLGIKKTTTRTNEGGSGIGYMAVFQILRELNASLVIAELKPEESLFTKSVAVRFDGKAQFLSPLSNSS